MAASTTTDNFKVIGTRPIRHDGVDKVTGRAKYGADYAFPGMLHGKVLRSPHAHANIKSINIDKALKLPGVKAIVTGKDLPKAENKLEQAGEMVINPMYLSMNILAHDKVLYDGHAIAAVAATSPHIAEEALRLIEVEYEVLPPVMTVDAATKPGAPILLKDLRNKEEGDKPTNVAQHYQFKRGDVEAGFKAADFVIEREFNTAMVHQGYIEPHNAVGIYNSDGQATIYCSTQGAFDVRSLSAQVLGMPVGKIKVVPAEIGGGFGGKTTIYLEPLSVLLSKKTGAPVKLVMSRAEVLRASGPTSGSKIKVKMGATKDGKLVAAEIWMAYEAGAFPGSPVGAGAMCIIAPYTIENFLIDAYDVVVNRPKTAAYRAPGATNAAFASETVIDELAEKCGIDPIDFRLKNAVKEGDAQVVGPPFKRIGLIETLEGIKNSPHYKSKLTGKFRGRGVASGFWFNAGMQSSATVNIHADGTASVVTGSPDIGGSRASMAMITAEVLGTGRDRRAPDRRRHRFDRPYRRDRRQPRHLRNRDGGVRSRQGRRAPVDRARRQGLGEEARRSGIPRRQAPRQRQRRAADVDQAARAPLRAHRRTDHRSRERQRARRRTWIRDDLRRRRGRSRHRQSANPAMHRRAGCGQGDSSELRRRPDAGRHRAGYSAGRSTKNIFTTTRARCVTPDSSTTGCRPASTCR